MKKKGLIVSLFSLIGLFAICSLIGGNYLVGAIDVDADKEKAMRQWCSGSDIDSVVNIYGNFSANYKFPDWSENEKRIPGKCSVVGDNTISCSYSFNNKGMYNVAIDYDGGTQFIYPDGNGNISFTVTASPGSEVAMYSYPNKPTVSSCKTDADGTIGKADAERINYIFNYTFSMPTSKSNEFFNDSMCESFRKATQNTNYSNYASSNVPECYDEKSDINIMTDKTTIQNKIAITLGYIKDGLSLKSDEKNNKVSPLYCQFDTNKNKSQSSNSSSSVIKSFTSVEDIKDNKGNVWYKVSCTENMTIEYDAPKASYTSGGFKYTVKLNSKKSCKVIPVRQPVTPSVCRPSFYFSDHNSQFGGPNEDFDSCVQRCDGGIYSNECSNACYSEIYEQKKTLDQISFLNSNISSSFNNIEKMIFTPSTKNGKAWCSTQSNVPSGRAHSPSTNNGEWHWQVCPSKATMIAKGIKSSVTINNAYTTGAGTHGEGYIRDNGEGEVYGCVYGWQADKCNGEMVCTNNCSSNSVETEAQAREKYNQEVALQSEAKDIIKQKYGKCSENSDGTFTCSDENTTEEATKNATITRKVKNKGNDLADNQGFVNFTGTTAPTISYNTNKTNSFINFPKAFISLENGKILYRNQESAEMLGYIFGGYLFYTDPNTTAKDTNNIRYYPEYANSFGITDGIMAKTGLTKGSTYGKDSSLTIDWNIVTQIRNFGSYKQWDIDVNCFYGADVSKCGDDPDKPCDSDPSCPTGKNCDTIPECTGGNCIGGNLPYRYRTVNLSDLFPDREAGYNWKDNDANKNASTTNYVIDPTSLISDIESKGNSIYKNNNNIYTNLAIGKNGLSWRETRKGDLYTKFDGSYKSKNGISFFNSKYVVNNKQNTNRTK